MDIQVGDYRRSTLYPESRREPHKIMRISEMNAEVAVKYADKTTAWIPLDMYLAETEAVYVTRTGKVLTDADIEAFAEEAERGYKI